MSTVLVTLCQATGLCLNVLGCLMIGMGLWHVVIDRDEWKRRQRRLQEELGRVYTHLKETDKRVQVLEEIAMTGQLQSGIDQGAYGVPGVDGNGYGEVLDYDQDLRHK